MDLGNGVRRTTSSEELSMAFIFSVLHQLKQNFYYNQVGDVANTALKDQNFFGHLSHPGGLLLWIGVCRRVSCGVRRASSVNIFFSRTTGQIFTKLSMHVASVG